jgi:hypothetical protein
MLAADNCHVLIYSSDFPFRALEKSDITHRAPESERRSKHFAEKKTARGVNNWRIKFRWASQPRESKVHPALWGSSVSCVVASRTHHRKPVNDQHLISSNYGFFLEIRLMLLGYRVSLRRKVRTTASAPRVYFGDGRDSGKCNMSSYHVAN